MRGYNDYFAVANNFTPTDYPSICYFIVFRPATTQVGMAGLISTDAGTYGRALSMNGDGKYLIEYFEGFANTAVSYSPEQWATVSLQFAGFSSTTLGVNGVLSSAPASGMGNNEGGLTIGSFNGTTGYAEYNASFDVAEILIYGASLSTNNRQLVEGYLAWKWGITSNLPSDHPYKTTSPGSAVTVYATQSIDANNNLQISATSNVRITAPTDWRYVTGDVGTTSLTLNSSNTGVLYRLTNTGFDTLTLPTDQASSNKGMWWKFYNDSGANVTVSLTNNVGLTSPQTLSNSVMYILYWNGSSNYLVSAVGATGPPGADGAAGADGATGATGPPGADGATGAAGTNGTNGSVGATGPAGSNGTDGSVGATGPTGPAGAGGGSKLTVTESAATSLTLTSGNYNTFFYLTNSGFNALTLPASTATTDGGNYWTLRNSTATYLSITLTNTLTLTSPLVIPPGSTNTLVVSGTSANTILLF
jgi:hypothetical protein